jgi:hypothetical protein
MSGSSSIKTLDSRARGMNDVRRYRTIHPPKLIQHNLASIPIWFT